MVFPTGLRPISIAEFTTYLHRCIPPCGWSSTIAVANSGGPDSACLLYLLNSVFHHSEHGIRGNLPQQVISINVDHGLQDSSSYMSQVAGQNAKRFDIQHVTARVPWSTEAFPPIPEHGIETMARSARYRVLLDQMRQRHARILAVGHHAYDQQETILMRLKAGTSEERDPVGMSYVRRWGMGQGQKPDLQYYGMHGMDRWIIRPLLGFGKDRILATCEQHRIEYVTDKTNFQPDLTIRNKIRAELNKPSQLSVAQDDTYNAESITQSRELLKHILSEGYTHQAHNTLNRMTVVRETEDIHADRTLSRILAECRPAPGTFILPVNEIQALSPSILRLIVLRLLRYVSPHPWGSPAAESHRNTASINRIISTLLESVDTTDQSSPPHARRSFTAGGGVLWSPVAIKANHQGVHREVRAGERAGWLLTRSPPYNRRARGRSSTLSIDLTNWISLPTNERRNEWVERPFDWPIGLRHAFDLGTWLSSYQDEGKEAHTSFLWDNRFLLTFDLGRTRALLHTIGRSSLVVMTDKSRGAFAPSVRIINSDIGWVTIGDADQSTPFVNIKFIRPLGQ